MTMIQCYLLNDFHQLKLPDDYLTRLNDAQRVRINSMSNKRKHEYFFARQLLTFAITTHCHNNDGTDTHWQIIERENNSPLISLNNGQTINCSITHSPTWLGVVLSSGVPNSQISGDNSNINSSEINPPKIGIDIETIQRHWSIEKAKLFCNSTQITHAFTLNKNSERDLFLTKIWTQKEAYFKAGGEQVFNKNFELIENADTPYSLISEQLSNESIMSIYSDVKAPVTTTRLSYLDDQFVFEPSIIN